MKIYLAGPISGQSYEEAQDWRVVASHKLTELGHEPLSPLRGKEFLRRAEVIEPFTKTRNVMTTAKGLTTRDRWDCLRADVVLANFADSGDRVSIGTCIELGWADMTRIPVVAVIPKGNVHEHPIVLEIVGFRVETLAKALDLINIMGASL